MMTKAEIARRKRMIRNGEWDDTVIVFIDDSEAFCATVKVYSATMNKALAVKHDGTELIFDIADVSRVVH